MNILKIFIIFLNIIHIYSFNLIFNVGSTGLLIPYSLGSLAYIKHNININDVKLIGTSGGSWCSLLYYYENDLSNHDKLWNILLNDEKYTVNINKNFDLFTNKVKNNLLLRYKYINHKKVNESPISINVLKYNNLLDFKNLRINKFENIEEQIIYCYCSSYIPFYSGKSPYYKYNNNYYMDGALLNKDNYAYNILEKKKIINNKYVKLNINYKMWGRKYSDIKNKCTLNINISRDLYNMGWNDTKINIHKYLYI